MTEKIDETLIDKARKGFQTVPYARFLGMEMVSLTGGAAVLKLAVRAELRQPLGVLHGGATASLIDTAMAFAVITCLERNENAVTVDLNIHYLRPISSGEIICTAKVLRAGRSILTVSAECAAAGGKLTATALSTYMKI